MEYRKLIKFGKSSFVISIPKGWLNSNNLKKGNVVSIKEQNNDLVVSAQPSPEDNISKEIVIDVKGKDFKDLRRAIVSAYISNNHTIILKGSDISSKSKQIRDIMHNLVALEIMEQTSDRVVAKDFLDMKETSVLSLVRKMDMIVRAMLSDATSEPSKDLGENLKDRDMDVNRLSFLLFRAIKAALSNPALASHMKLGSVDLLNYWQITSYLERIGDEVKRIYPYLMDVEKNSKVKKTIYKVFKEIEEDYLNMMKSFYNKDMDTAFKVAEKNDPMLKICDDVLTKNYTIKGVAHIISKLKVMVETTHHIGRVIYG